MKPAALDRNNENRHSQSLELCKPITLGWTGNARCPNHDLPRKKFGSEAATKGDPGSSCQTRDSGESKKGAGMWIEAIERGHGKKNKREGGEFLKNTWATWGEGKGGRE